MFASTCVTKWKAPNVCKQRRGVRPSDATPLTYAITADGFRSNESRNTRFSEKSRRESNMRHAANEVRNRELML